MFEVNLCVKKGEKVLVFTDDSKSAITEDAKLVAEPGESFGKIIFLNIQALESMAWSLQKGFEKSLWRKNNFTD